MSATREPGAGLRRPAGRRPRGAPLARDLLAVDVGNTKVLAVLFRAGSECFRWRVEYRPGAGWAPAWGRALAAARRLCGARLPILVASVAPRRDAVLEPRLRRAGLGRFHRVGWRDPWPYALAVHEPERVGADRLANVGGLVALGLGSGIAIDAGTAVTVDVLDGGRFRGGLILPGFALMARALHAHTARLPLVEPRAPAELVGGDTRAALASGIHHGLTAAVEAIARRILAGLGREARVVFTGGDGERLAAACRIPGARHEPDLLLLGLRALGARILRRAPASARRRGPGPV